MPAERADIIIDFSGYAGRTLVLHNNLKPDDADVSRRFAESVRAAFSEDKVILEAVQRGMDEMTATGGTNVNLRSDTGGVRFRRRLGQMIDAERSSLRQ